MSSAFNKGYREDFAEVLKKQRKQVGVNQKDFAKAIGVSRAAVSLYESGQRLPSEKVLLKIASIFNVPADYYARKISK